MPLGHADDRIYAESLQINPRQNGFPALGMGLFITRPIKQFVRQSKKLLEGETDLTQRL